MQILLSQDSLLRKILNNLERVKFMGTNIMNLFLSMRKFLLITKGGIDGRLFDTALLCRSELIQLKQLI